MVGSELAEGIAVRAAAASDVSDGERGCAPGFGAACGPIAGGVRVAVGGGVLSSPPGAGGTTALALESEERPASELLGDDDLAPENDEKLTSDELTSGVLDRGALPPGRDERLASGLLGEEVLALVAGDDTGGGGSASASSARTTSIATTTR
jgi:hypothetical protein